MKPLLSEISAELTALLEKRGKLHTYLPGKHLFTEGDEALFLPIVRSGNVKMVHMLDSGKEIIIGIFGEGEMFAVPPVFDGKKYPSTAVAMDKTKLLLIHRSDFLDLLRESSEFAFAVIEWMTEMLREKTATIQNLATASPEHRVGTVLLKLAGSGDVKLPVRISLRREDIGRIAGLTTETTIRVVRRLADKKLLRIEHGKIFIDDPAPLRRYVTH
jgi:CRP/FNR family transcriptional regulator